MVLPNGNFITDTVYYNSQEDEYFDLTDYQNVAEFASCNQAYQQYKSPIYQESRDSVYKTEPSGLGEDAVETRINDGVVTDDYITERTQYAEERISISNAIIYYDMIKKESEDSDTDTTGTDTQTDVTTISGAVTDSKTASQDNSVTTAAS